MKIHSTAVVSSRAEIHSGVEIGPFCVVEPGATIGQDVRLAARATVKTQTILGRGVVVEEGAVLGGLPQHLSPPGEPGRAVIGEGCVIRENATIHRSLYADGETRIGQGAMLMVGAHVAHDCQLGAHVILTNNVLLGGHVHVGERACLGGAVAVHQFCRVGRLAMIGGCARIIQDVPPFVLADGDSGMIVGLNRVGLRRAGLPRDAVADLKAAYRLIYREGLSFDEVLNVLTEQFQSGPAAEFAEFFADSRRGFVQERRSPPKTAIRLHPAADAESTDSKRLAG